MIHFTHLSAWNVEASPSGEELRRMGVEHRFLATPVSLRYRSQMELLVRIYPLLLVTALRNAVRSLGRRATVPDAVVISTDVEALAYGLVRAVFRRRTLIVFRTFIVTPRQGGLRNALYMLYWRLIAAVIDLAICHARAEVAVYASVFPREAAKFVFVPFGAEVRNAQCPAETGARDGAVVVAAGRSSRDYATLARAIEGLPCRLRLICDIPGPLANVAPSSQITVVKGCFDDAYMAELARASIVVVPLAKDDVSAGQIVLLQAAALGRAVIITRTSTTTDYATDEVDALMVGRGDVAAMRAALVRLLESAELRARLGAAAAARFRQEHSAEAFMRGIVAEIASLCPAVRAGREEGSAAAASERV